jgi:hypothetical protein
VADDPDERVIDIEDLMAEGSKFRTTIRLLSLACLTCKGATFKLLEYIKAEFLQVRRDTFYLSQTFYTLARPLDINICQ